jgi:predicted RNA-binding Zn-ribbon protein involved in translation (DUF1610 family)
MDNFSSLLFAGLIFGLVGWLCLKGFSKFWPKSGKMGVNLEVVACPQCGEVVPKIRKPANTKQLLWGGWTCSNCGTEMDKYGSKI